MAGRVWRQKIRDQRTAQLFCARHVTVCQQHRELHTESASDLEDLDDEQWSLTPGSYSTLPFQNKNLEKAERHPDFLSIELSGIRITMTYSMSPARMCTSNLQSTAEIQRHFQ